MSISFSQLQWITMYQVLTQCMYRLSTVVFHSWQKRIYWEYIIFSNALICSCCNTKFSKNLIKRKVCHKYKMTHKVFVKETFMNINAILMLPEGFITTNSFNENLLGHQVKSRRHNFVVFYGLWRLACTPHIFIFNQYGFTFI